jgi:hypothetical protein
LLQWVLGHNILGLLQWVLGHNLRVALSLQRVVLLLRQVVPSLQQVSGPSPKQEWQDYIPIHSSRNKHHCSSDHGGGGDGGHANCGNCVPLDGARLRGVCFMWVLYFICGTY